MRDGVRLEFGTRRIAVVHREPARARRAGDDLRTRPRSGCSNLAVSFSSTIAYFAPPICTRSRTSSGDSRGGRQHDRAELHRGEHRIPQLDTVRQHQQDPVAAHDADQAQPVRDPRRALGHLRERIRIARAGRRIDDPQRGLVVAARHRVEVVERPVECVEHRPLELAVRGLVVGAMAQQKVARVQECLYRHRVLQSPCLTVNRACAAAHARLPLLRRTVTSLRAAFAALPSCPA